MNVKYFELAEALVGEYGVERYTHQELLDYIHDLVKAYQS
mgnify:CR=1 FL=1